MQGIMSRLASLLANILWHLRLILTSRAMLCSPFQFMQFHQLRSLSRTISILTPFQLNAQELFLIVSKFFLFSHFLHFSSSNQPFQLTNGLPLAKDCHHSSLRVFHSLVIKTFFLIYLLTRICPHTQKLQLKLWHQFHLQLLLTILLVMT